MYLLKLYKHKQFQQVHVLVEILFISHVTACIWSVFQNLVTNTKPQKLYSYIYGYIIITFYAIAQHGYIASCIAISHGSAYIVAS